MKKNIALFIIALVSFPLNAQELNELKWMSGYWTGTQNGTSMEELWSTPSGGIMLGFHRDVFPGNRSFFEYLRIVKTPEGITYFASPRGGAVTPFTLTETSQNKAVFENLEHDFPQRIIYSREGSKLTARIEDESGNKSQQWTWTKAEFK